MSDGFLLLHGKGAGPEYPACAMRPLYNQMVADGLTVDYVANSWAQGKLYTQPFEDSIPDIHQGIGRLVRQGATRIHIVGHSLGANVAFFYATQYTNFASIVALAPAHNTHLAKFNHWSLWSRNKAKSLIDSGNDASADFIDVAMAEVYITQGIPSAYFSYLNPEGNTVMTRNVRKFLAPVNLFIGTGAEDVTQVNVKSMLFDPARKTPSSQLLQTQDDHISVVANSYPNWRQWCVNLAG
jgi:pimeloyl-ACP methyl ester carboxylesterase